MYPAPDSTTVNYECDGLYKVASEHVSEVTVTIVAIFDFRALKQTVNC